MNKLNNIMKGMIDNERNSSVQRSTYYARPR